MGGTMPWKQRLLRDGPEVPIPPPRPPPPRGPNLSWSIRLLSPSSPPPPPSPFPSPDECGPNVHPRRGCLSSPLNKLKPSNSRPSHCNMRPIHIFPHPIYPPIPPKKRDGGRRGRRGFGERWETPLSPPKTPRPRPNSLLSPRSLTLTASSGHHLDR